MADTMTDYAYRFFRALVTGDSSLSGAINVSRAAVGVEATSSVVGYGEATTPAAGATVATTVDIAGGTHEVEVTVFANGTLVAALDSSNMKLFSGAVLVGQLISPASGTASLGPGVARFRVAVVGTVPFTVKATATATTGAKYHAQIVANKIGF